MIHNEEALKNFKYDGNESTYSVHISDHTDSWEEERLVKIGLGKIFDVMSHVNVLCYLQHHTS